MRAERNELRIAKFMGSPDGTELRSHRLSAVLENRNLGAAVKEDKDPPTVDQGAVLAPYERYVRKNRAIIVISLGEKPIARYKIMQKAFRHV